MASIGFIGLGHMGYPMVCNLLQAQHQVKVFDQIPAAMQRCAAKGASIAQSLIELAADTDIIITMLPTGDNVCEVCLGEQGLFQLAKSGTLFIDSSSIAVSIARELHQAAQEQAMIMVDAPVSGGVAGAEVASLTFMVGGDEQAFQQAKPLLSTMGKAIIHAGAAGNGQAAKICNNMILGISMIAVSESFALAEKLGLDADKLFEISSQASGQCWSMTSYCPVPGMVSTSPANRDYEAGFSGDMMLKDLRLSQKASQKVKARTPLGAEATALYAKYSSLGFGKKDFSGIIKMLKGE